MDDAAIAATAVAAAVATAVAIGAASTGHARLRSISWIIAYSIPAISILVNDPRTAVTPWNATDRRVRAWSSFVGLIASAVLVASNIRELVTHA
jgi:hypothetical protein